jgi:prevent-host-death family protein
MTRVVNIYDAKTNLSKLLLDVERGEEILIARAGEPVAKLSPIQKSTRELGFVRDQIWVSEDFDDTPEEIIDDFYR